MKEKQSIIIYWSRRDFRLTDNPALHEAVHHCEETGAEFLPLFILEDYMLEAKPEYQFGYPSRYFLSRALPHFASNFPHFIITKGKAAHTLILLSKVFTITIFVNEDVYIDFYKQIKKLRSQGIDIKLFKDFLTVDRETKTGQGNYYSVFTPFKNTVWNEFISAPVKPKVNASKIPNISKETLTTLQTLIPIVSNDTETLLSFFSSNRLLKVGGTIIDLDACTSKPDLSQWYTTEEDALSHFKAYLASDLLTHYKDNRDSLEKDTEMTVFHKSTLRGKTSKMSLALAWGLISARTLKEMIQKYSNADYLLPLPISANESVVAYISELIWREFYKYLYVLNPDLMNIEFQKKFRGTIEWVEGAEAKERYTAWIQGKTGYPVVDAAMNQLAATGWMHNRSRMIVASILTKNFGVDWRWGQEYFRATLIDLDETSNNGGWQWGASVGADPKPIRIFNAELQAKNYDASMKYQNTWLQGGETISPIVEHKVGREEALKRYKLSGQKPRDY